MEIDLGVGDLLLAKDRLAIAHNGWSRAEIISIDHVEISAMPIDAWKQASPFYVTWDALRHMIANGTIEIVHVVDARP